MSQLNSLRNRTDRHQEPGGALLGFQFSSAEGPRLTPIPQMASNCTGNLLQHPQDPSPSDFSV